jgi:hypothetical protein
MQLVKPEREQRATMRSATTRPLAHEIGHGSPAGRQQQAIPTRHSCNFLTLHIINLDTVHSKVYTLPQLGS